MYESSLAVNMRLLMSTEISETNSEIASWKKCCDIKHHFYIIIIITKMRKKKESPLTSTLYKTWHYDPEEGVNIHLGRRRWRKAQIRTRAIFTTTDFLASTTGPQAIATTPRRHISHINTVNDISPMYTFHKSDSRHKALTETPSHAFVALPGVVSLGHA